MDSTILIAGISGSLLFVIDGEIEIDGLTLDKRDSMGIWDTDLIAINFRATSNILIIETPING